MLLLSWLIPPLYSFVDYLRYYIWTTSPDAIDYLELAATQAPTYEEWLACQKELDSVQDKHSWLSKDQDPHYDWGALRGHKLALEHCRESGDNRGLASLLRSYSSRNTCRILSPSLYQHSHIRTKNLIHGYLNEVQITICHLTRRESMIASPNVVSGQDKRQLFNDVKQSLGRTSLVLQGGATFSLCHLGVIKALHAQGLLPQIITGTATGALVAALVCTTPSFNLEGRLKGESIDLAAFQRARARRTKNRESSGKVSNWVETVVRRVNRLHKTGHVFDIAVLQEFARDNFGEITFGEAYTRTGRILNITVALSDVPGMPQLLNYITAPHVFIWSAVVASIATSKMMYGQVKLFCRDESGNLAEVFASDATLKTPHNRSVSQELPLKRIGELFNVNHFIISQTRPYIIPFVRQQQQQQPNSSILGTLFHALVTAVLAQLLHMLLVLSRNGWAPAALSRILVDEAIPTSTNWSKITIIPDLHLQDAFRVFDIPTLASIEEWSLRGERSVWPAICELRVRCGIEFDLDAAYNNVQRRPPGQAYERPP